MVDREDTESQRERLLYVDIDEDDPFEEVSLSVGEDDTSLRVGTVEAAPGRYVLVREKRDPDD